MDYLPNNIKKIRKLYQRTQEKFAEDLQISLAMQKSYEGGKAKPGIIYMEQISKLSGTSIQDLTGKDLNVSDLKQKVEKVKLDFALKVNEKVKNYEFDLYPGVPLEEQLKSRIKAYEALLESRMQTIHALQSEVKSLKELVDIYKQKLKEKDNNGTDTNTGKRSA